MGVDWGYYDDKRFEDANEEYLPLRGEGGVMATQICTAINKLIYKWYNDGDVFDNTYNLCGWCNDISSFANWLYTYVPGADTILDGIKDCYTDGDYEDLLQKLADAYLNLDFLNRYSTAPAINSVYKVEEPYHFVENDEDEDWDDEEEWDVFEDEDGEYD